MPSAPLPTRADVVVLGGGLAGLTCAVGLAERGLKPLVLERDARLGGRAASWIDQTTGDPVHIGPHILLSEYPNMLALLEQCGTQDRISWQWDHFLTIVEGRRSFAWKLSQLPPPMTIMPSIVMSRSMSALDLLSSVRVTFFAMHMSEADVLDADQVNAYAFLKAMGVTEQAIQRHWAFMSMSILNVPIELCSAGAMLRFYRRLTGHRNFCAGMPTIGLGDLFCPGAKQLIERAGGRVATDVRVTGFLVEGGRVCGVTLSDGRKVRAREVVSSLPPNALGAIVPRAWKEEHASFRELGAFHPCPYIATYLWFDRKLTHLRFWARAWSPNDLNCDFYDYSNIYSGRSLPGSLIASNIIFSHRASHLSDDDIVEETRRELAEFLPQSKRARLVHAVVNRIPMAIHCPFPGTERRRPDAVSPIRGLTLAGDWTRTELPSSMESACMSGWRAAEVVLGALGREHVELVRRHKAVEGFSRLVHGLARVVPSRPLRRLGRPLKAAPLPVWPM